MLTTLLLEWQDLFLLYLVTQTLRLKIQVKYGEDYREPHFEDLNFPDTKKSFIKPLAENPSFGTDKWDFEVFAWSEKFPIYLIRNDFQLIYGASLFTRPVLHKIHTEYAFYTITALPESPVETQHMVARHPLAHPASFDPFLPLDFWSWILTIIGRDGHRGVCPIMSFNCSLKDINIILMMPIDV